MVYYLRFGFQNQLPTTSPACPKHICRRPPEPFVGIFTSRFWRLAGVATGSVTMNDKAQIVLGNREDWGGPTPFSIAVPDRRHHVYVIGKTGSGKTTFLRNMVIQDIRLGHGVGLIDPHGDLAEDLLNQVPRSMIGNVVYFNPADVEFPAALNLLARVPADERALVASGVVGAFKSIWRESWGPRMEYIFYNALAALLDCENISLLGINPLLSDSSFRRWVIRQIEDPFIKTFWEHEYAAYDQRFRNEAIAPIQNKLGQFLLNPVIRNILGQVKCKVSFPFVMDNDQLFIANLAKGKLGHDKANLLGSLLVTQFQLAAMRRASRPEVERRDFHLVIDEFQNFTTDAFASLLAEARKYRLSLTLAHQYVDQLPLPVRQAVFGNVGTLVVFRLGYADAEVLVKEMDQVFSEATLVGLDRYEAVVKLLQDGTNPTPFLAKMLPPMDYWSGRKDVIIGRSRERFATPRGVVETKLRKWADHKGSLPLEESK